MENNDSVGYEYFNQSIVWVPCILDFSTNFLVPLYTPSNFPRSSTPKSPAKISRGGLKSQPWTHEEDQKIIELVTKYGKKNWVLVANLLNSELGLTQRKGKHCRERWFNHLDPRLNKGEWTYKEDIFILKQQLKLGNKWSLISKRMKGRTENAVKNRWNCLIKKMQADPSHRLLPIESLIEILISRFAELQSKLDN